MKKVNSIASRISRRRFLQAGTIGAAGLAALTRAAPRAEACLDCITDKLAGKFPIGQLEVVGDRLIPRNAAPLAAAAEREAPAALEEMNPMKFLTAFNAGEVTALPGGGVRRDFVIQAMDRELEVAPGIVYPAWTYNGFMPGPTLRATAGDHLRVHFTNASSMPHTMHFHGVHPANMDGVFEVVPVGKTFTYEFTAEPFGLFPYHCHVMPLRKHIARGLYGALIVDPPDPRPPAREMVMVMHGLDVDFDMENEFYAVNGFANYYAEHPIEIGVGEKIRIYLVNMTEFDLVNNLHIHANMFDYFPNGTSLVPQEHTDTVNLCQGQRGILEFSYKFPGVYMFHAHTSEFAELGWMGFFYVKESGAT